MTSLYGQEQQKMTESRNMMSYETSSVFAAVNVTVTVLVWMDPLFVVFYREVVKIHNLFLA